MKIKFILKSLLIIFISCYQPPTNNFHEKIYFEKIPLNNTDIDSVSFYSDSSYKEIVSSKISGPFSPQEYYRFELESSAIIKIQLFTIDGTLIISKSLGLTDVGQYEVVLKYLTIPRGMYIIIILANGERIQLNRVIL